jgi:hypothetical protein
MDLIVCPMPDKTLVGWLYRYARKNYYRVAHYMELTDLQQEYYKVYTRCFYRYPNTKNRHLMALVRRSVINHTHDLARRGKTLKNFVLETDLPNDALIDLGPEFSPIERLEEAEARSDLQGILMVIAEAPTTEVRSILVTFLTEGVAFLSRPIIDRLRLASETPCEYICRVLGWEPVVAKNALYQTRKYLHGDLLPV